MDLIGQKLQLVVQRICSVVLANFTAPFCAFPEFAPTLDFCSVNCL